MKVLEEVNEFLGSLDEEVGSATGNEIRMLVKEDIEFFQNEVSNALLRGSIKLDNSWSIYILSDVDIYLCQDMLKFADKLEMFGIRGWMPPIRSTDTAMAIVYRFSCYDVLGKPMDTVTGFHVGIAKRTGNPAEKKPENAYIMNKFLPDSADRKIFMYG